ncbi:hypothetical protein PNEG_01364 [Pneumocystis murina B123]|uniref:Uncharacterized protein n=1 Tax=Pneumocystis murina (strain B123) TaxID=1069680 RepID=M7PJM7_PNEMU|nr:hypothetical protein PNEG_01364 [Pneumocystis murina B123]EMR10664.1 hypothetical protein PNEG_01364 [Pneumocystis murina B123]
MRFNEAKSSSPDPLDILSSSKPLYLTPNCRQSLNLSHQKLELSTEIRRIGLYVDIGSDREEVFFVSPKKTSKHTGIKTSTKKSCEIKDEGNSDISFNEIVSSCKKILDGKKKGKKKPIKQKRKTSNTQCLNTNLAFMQDVENILEAEPVKEAEIKHFDEEDTCLYNNMIFRERKNVIENHFYFDKDVMDVDNPEIISSNSTNELVKKSNNYTTNFKKLSSKKRLNIEKKEKMPNTTKILDSADAISEPNISIEPALSLFPKKNVLIEISSLSKASAERAANALTLTGRFEFESIQNQEDSDKCQEIFQEKRCWTKDEWKLLELLLIKHKKIKKTLDCFLKVNSDFSEEEVDKRLKVLLFKKKENYYLNIDKKNKLNNHIEVRNNKVSNSVFEWKNWLKW